MSEGRKFPIHQFIAVVGSRDYPLVDRVREVVSEFPANAVVVSGGARGVDSLAVDAAKSRGLETLIFEPDWELYGKAAGPMRNAQIVGMAHRLVAFWNGTSRGTLNSVAQAHKLEVPTTVYGADGRPLPIDEVAETARAMGVFKGLEKARRNPGIAEDLVRAARDWYSNPLRSEQSIQGTEYTGWYVEPFPNDWKSRILGPFLTPERARVFHQIQFPGE